jgi:hypothetical protein
VGGTEKNADGFTRVGLPANLSDIVRATLIVHYKSDTSLWEIRINNVSTGMKFSVPGRYDVTAFIASDSGARMFANAGYLSATGLAEYQLELLVRT